MVCVLYVGIKELVSVDDKGIVGRGFIMDYGYMSMQQGIVVCGYRNVCATKTQLNLESPF